MYFCVRRLEVSENLYFLLENLRKERKTVSCMNTVTKWGESVTMCLSVGPEFAFVGLPA